MQSPPLAPLLVWGSKQFAVRFGHRAQQIEFKFATA